MVADINSLEAVTKILKPDVFAMLGRVRSFSFLTSHQFRRHAVSWHCHDFFFNVTPMLKIFSPCFAKNLFSQKSKQVRRK